MIKILIVSEDEQLRETIGEFIHAEGGYSTISIDDGNKALELFKSNPVDLVFIDLALTTINANDVFRRLRKLKPFLKVVIISDSSSQQDFSESLISSEEMVEGFIFKPLNTGELKKSLRIAVEGNTHTAFHLMTERLEILGGIAKLYVLTFSRVLSGIMQKSMEASLQQVNILSLEHIARPLEEPGLSSVCLNSQFSGAINGNMLFLTSWKDSLLLIDSIKKIPFGSTRVFDDLGQVYLKSAGTIFIKTCFQEISQRLKLSAKLEVPELAFEHRNALIKAITEKLAPARKTKDEYLFTIEMKFSIINSPINCWFILVSPGNFKQYVLDFAN
ncbi:MAG: response regulator [Planctomycetes bacterium]|nr:response regulator [Planctomycetota bacterium]